MDHHIKTGDSTIGMFLKDLKNKEMHTLDDWTPSAESNKMIHDVIYSSDITVAQAHASKDKYQEHMKSIGPTKRVLDALTASIIDPGILPKKGKAEFIHKFGRYTKNESIELTNARNVVSYLSEKHQFFHWELEMMDAFTDSRRGFDVIVGNPPWDKNKPNDDEFFTPYDPAFRSLNIKSKKITRQKELLVDSNICEEYKLYRKRFEEKSKIYTTYKLQGVGDKELSKLIFERILDLVVENGMICMVLPSQILSNVGSTNIRKNLLKRNIMSLYVFENKYKIFQILSSIRFVLLSMRNMKGADEFLGGFYLHRIESLQNKERETEKFGTISKQLIWKMSPDTCVIPEVIGERLKILATMCEGNNLEFGLGKGWKVLLSRGFDRTNDANLLLEDGKGWPVHEGKTIHQYNHIWDRPEFTADMRDGLERMSRVKKFTKKHREVHDSFRLVFRDIARSTDIRTIISTIIPPHTFHTYSLRSIILTYDSKIMLDSEYLKNIAYLCGILNSTSFDFVARASAQLHISTIIQSFPIPKHDYKDKIVKLAASLMVGSQEFEGFADVVGIENKKLSPAERIEHTAEIDALVAYSYNLTKEQYKVVIDSFKAFKANPNLYDLKYIVWDSNNLKGFYGEMASVALQYYDRLPEQKKP